MAKTAYIVGLAGGGFMGCSVIRNMAEDAEDLPCAGLSGPMTPAQAEAVCASCDQAESCAGAPGEARQADRRAIEVA